MSTRRNKTIASNLQSLLLDNIRIKQVLNISDENFRISSTKDLKSILSTFFTNLIDISGVNMVYVTNGLNKPLFNSYNITRFLPDVKETDRTNTGGWAWFSSTNSVPIRFRLNETNLVNMILESKIIDTLDIKDIVEKITDNRLSPKFINNILSSNLIDIEKKSDNIYSEIYIKKIIIFLKKFVSYMSTKKRNIIFYPIFSIKPMVINENKTGLPFIYDFDNYNKSYKTMMFMISLPDNLLSENISMKNPLDLFKAYSEFTSKTPDKVIYEYVGTFNVDNGYSIQYELNKALINVLETEKLILHHSQKPTSVPEDGPSSIEFNPIDKIEPLKVIEIEISPNIKRTFLLGKTGNLYEDDNNLNDLVGNISNLDVKKDSLSSAALLSGTASVYWCKKYVQTF